MKLKDYNQIPPKTTGIYKLTNTITGKEYVGQAVNIKIRIARYSRGDMLGQTKLFEAYKTYGPDSFDVEILTTCSREELDDYETNAMLCFDTIDNGYNCESNKSYISYEDLTANLHLSIKEACKHFNICRTTLNGWSLAYYSKYYTDISSHIYHKKALPTKEQLARYKGIKARSIDIANELGISTTTLSLLSKQYFDTPIHIYTDYNSILYPSISKEAIDRLISENKNRVVAAAELGVDDKTVDKYTKIYYGCSYARMYSRYKLNR